GDTVTIDDRAASTIVVGDDTGDALTVNGTLQYLSTATVDHTLRLKGNLKINDGGEFHIGTSTNPIPSTRSFTIELNYSASLSSEKYNLYVYDGATFKMYGYRPTLWHTTLSSDASATDTTIYTSDSTGWGSNDEIVLIYRSGSQSSTSMSELKTISSVSGTTINLSSGLSYAQDSGTSVVNISRNLKITSYDSSYEAKVMITKTTDDSSVFFKNVYFTNLTKITNIADWQESNLRFDGCYFDHLTIGPGLDNKGGIRVFDDCVGFGTKLSGNAYESSSTYWQLTSCYFGDDNYIDNWRSMQVLYIVDSEVSMKTWYGIRDGSDIIIKDSYINVHCYSTGYNPIKYYYLNISNSTFYGDDTKPLIANVKGGYIYNIQVDNSPAMLETSSQRDSIVIVYNPSATNYFSSSSSLFYPSQGYWG
ncbi:MAG: G8 domain-containing protein, partial [Candidatus Heimdallarchaeaceae archaeon]